MASRILFEDELDNQDVNNINLLHEELLRKDDDEDYSSQDLTQEDKNRDFTDLNSDTKLISTKDSEISENVSFHGSRLRKLNEITIDSERNSQCEGNTQKEGNKTALETLGIDIKEENEDLYDQNDVYGYENKIFTKYKLRKTNKPVSISPDNEIDLTCPICQKEFENKVALLNHLRIHNKTVRGYTCSLCNKKFDKNADLIAHKHTHNEDSFFCQKCKLAFSNYCDFLLHNYEHLNQQHFKCPECGLRYRKGVYRVHITTHFDKYLSCHLCSFVTNNEQNLRIHVNQHSDKFTCVECGKACKSKEMYKYHMSIHTGVKKIQCLYCGAGFRTNCARKVHTRTHTGEKPFTCDLCGYKARQSTDLQRHKETHGEKKFTCDECGKKYLHKYYLVVHLRSHSKKSLYECPECNAQYATTAGLKTHSLLKHTSERPFECKACNRKFISDNQYRKHCRAKYHLRNVYKE